MIRVMECVYLNDTCHRGGVFEYTRTSSIEYLTFWYKKCETEQFKLFD